MKHFRHILKLAGRFELQCLASELPEVLKGLREILVRWVPQDRKELLESLAKYESEYADADEAVRRGELTEQNRSVMHQTHQNIRGTQTLLQFLPSWEKRIFKLHEHLKQSEPLDGKQLLTKFQTEANSILEEINDEAAFIKQRLNAHFNPRELKAFRKLSVIIRDHMSDLGKHPMLEPFPSRLRNPLSPGAMDPYEPEKKPLPWMTRYDYDDGMTRNQGATKQVVVKNQDQTGAESPKAKKFRP